MPGRQDVPRSTRSSGAVSVEDTQAHNSPSSGTERRTPVTVCWRRDETTTSKTNQPARDVAREGQAPPALPSYGPRSSATAPTRAAARSSTRCPWANQHGPSGPRRRNTTNTVTAHPAALRPDLRCGRRRSDHHLFSLRRRREWIPPPWTPQGYLRGLARRPNAYPLGGPSPRHTPTTRTGATGHLPTRVALPQSRCTAQRPSTASSRRRRAKTAVPPPRPWPTRSQNGLRTSPGRRAVLRRR